MTDKKFYLTNAIPYVNGPAHLGHTLEFTISDVINRYRRLQGYDVMFTCGSDENGQKIQEAANLLTESKKQNITPKKLADINTEKFKTHLYKLNVSFDVWRRATDQKLHWPGVIELWNRALAKGDIYKKSYTGLYCVGCEQFYTKNELVDGKCPEHLTTPETVTEENYFFKLSRYQKQLEELIANDTLKVFPLIRKNETLGFIRQGLQDFSVSRPAKRLGGWGIPVPDDPDQVMYVWFDALTIYMTAVGWNYNLKLWEKWWPADVHVIGKGIYRFHTVYWPAMLLSADLPLPKSVLVHGYVTAGGQKMAKSLGNTVDPDELLAKYGADPVRYYLLKEIPTQSDGDFTPERFKEVYNADLANGLGNLASRILTMATKFTDGKVPTIKQKPADHPLQKLEINTWKQLSKFVGEYQFNLALDAIWQLIHDMDKYITKQKPWELDQKDQLGEINWIVYGLLNGLKDLAWLIAPFLPDTANKILAALNLKPVTTESVYKNSFVDLEPGNKVKTIQSLFPRL